MNLPRPRRYLRPLGPPRLSARDKVLAAWRGVDLTPAIKANTRREQDAKTVMGTVLKDLRMDRRQVEAEVLNVWNSLIDPTLAIHA